MARTFTLKEETKNFMAFNRTEVMEACRNQMHAIEVELCKLTYLLNTYDHKHWIDIIVGVICSNATDKFKCKGKGKFDYSWFFDTIGGFDEHNAEAVYDALPPRYNAQKPEEIDPMRLVDNVNDLRYFLNEKYMKKGSLLTKQEVRDIIESLNLYEP